MSGSPQYLSQLKYPKYLSKQIDSYESKHLCEHSNTEITSDYKNHEENTIKEKSQENTITKTPAEETCQNTHTLFMKLKGFPSTIPGSKPSQPLAANLPYVNQIANTTADEVLLVLQNYKPKNEAIKQLFEQRPRSWKLHKYPNGVYYGEITNGRRHGKGIFVRHSKGSYEGEWENDLKHGEGLEFASNGSVYEGQYRNGKPDGFGIFLWPNGEIYEGDWKSGIKHGHGLWKGTKGEYYEGSWKQDKQEGYGVFVWRNGEKYEGEYFNFLKHGKGKEYFSNGDYYVGQYENGKPQGFGEYYWSNGSYYKGNFVNGLRHGKGTWNKQNGKNESYEGQWINDKKAGQGIYVWENGDFYKGNFFDNLREGYGEMHYSDGRIYKGTWNQGMQHGDGVILIPGQVVIKGTFEENKLMDGKGGRSVRQSFHLGADSINLDETLPASRENGVEIGENKSKNIKTEREMIRSENKIRGRRLTLSRFRQESPRISKIDTEQIEENYATSRLNQSEMIKKTKQENKNNETKLGQSFFHQKANETRETAKKENGDIIEVDETEIGEANGKKVFERKLIYNLKNAEKEKNYKDSSEDLEKLTQSYVSPNTNEQIVNLKKNENELLIQQDSGPDETKKESRSLSPVKNRKKSLVTQSIKLKENLASFEKYEPFGLTPAELHKWRNIKEKLYSNLKELEDLSNVKTRQKVRALISGPIWHPPGKVKN